MAGSTSKTIVIAGVVTAILAGCVGGVYMFAGAKLSQNQVQSGSASIAKATLTAAAVAVDMYASQTGSFAGLNAQAMAGIDTSNQWVDGEPAAGQVGITGVTDSSYIISVKESDGTIYSATKSQGQLVITDTNGNQI